MTTARKTVYFPLDPTWLQLFASRNEDIPTKASLPAKEHLPFYKNSGVNRWVLQKKKKHLVYHLQSNGKNLSKRLKDK